MIPAVGIIAIDNTLHSLIAVSLWIVIDRLSWEIVLDVDGLSIREECLLAYLIAAAVDSDHFLASFLSSGSITMHGATHLASRDLCIFHAPLIAVVIAAVVHTTGRSRTAVLVLSSMLSHQLRDATRTGLYMFPLGWTPVIPYLLFIITSFILIPILARQFLLAFGRRSGNGVLNK